ncbi:MSC_0623 family F1-like ATPase-associated protein [Mycoplasma buteonis]|uniref:MSC_0623 family F1-like ATPase-associated protein n=1 Tax=Mycoplasma buteonis TaxID=171280 RepID=UPI00068BEE10|nr:DUF2714 domain-containing protein [Mycoplasma buteonis]
MKIKNNNSKTNGNNPKELEYQNQIFQNYELAKQNSNFLSHQAFLNQFMLANNYSMANENWNNLYNEALKTLQSKNELIFDNFVLTFTRDLRFSLTDLVPDLADHTNAKIQSFAFNNASDNQQAKILRNFNSLLNELLNKGIVLELFPHYILSFDKVANKYTILFSKEVI